MGLGEGLKNMGRSMLGQRDRVQFKKSSEKLAHFTGISIEEAQVQLFKDHLTDVKDEIRFTQTLGSTSEHLQKLDAAISELGVDRAALKALARSSHYRRMSVPQITKSEFKTMEKFYKDRFHGKAPKLILIRDAAYACKSLEAHLNRVIGFLVGVKDIHAQIATDPAFAADLGKILFLKETIAGHERRFKQEVAHKAATEHLKKTAWDLLAQPVKSMQQFFTDTQRNKKADGLRKAAELFGATVVGLPLAALIIGGTLTYRAGHAMGRGISDATA